ncbi:DUF2092 domain-containing protein [Desulfogranum marinum]|uniref:DUF2092 domain-containing protein n=1 Tax=Desulfogranum marinum TaxID=453220 RepID=UPI0019645B08|nr:DUF2092 domain-containing protein [Desulfogranum marinum]MBM9513965.1 DUF2092 domain-containing protein [Desulfogranum marinum]
MNFYKHCIAMVALLLFSIGATHSQAQEASEKSDIDPVATAILKRMSDFIGKTKQFTVTTENTLEYLLDSGHRIDIDVLANVIVSRPNNLRAERRGKLVDQIFYYNGNVLTLYHPETNLYATESVPENYLELFRYMANTLGFAVPVSDLILEGSYSLLMEDVTLAAYLGRSNINGVLCDQLLFSRPGVDFQVWVAVGDQPFPYKYVVTDTSAPDRMSIRTTMRDWNFTPELKKTEFTFTPPDGAHKIEFLPF